MRASWSFTVVILLALLVARTPAALAQPQAAGPAVPVADAGADPERGEDPPAPVLLGGEPVIWITAGSQPYTPAFRADRISQRLEEAVHDPSLLNVPVVVTESDGSSELRLGPRLLMVVTARDAASVGASRVTLAQQHAAALDAAIRAERRRYAPDVLLRSALYGAAATALLVAFLWVVRRLSRRLRAAVERRAKRRTAALPSLGEELLRGDRLGRTIDWLIRGAGLVVVLAALNVYMTYVLGLFPWTRPTSLRLLGYLLLPVRALVTAFVGYLPKMLFLVVIVYVVYGGIRLVDLFFRRIGDGRLVFATFPAEWADPTNKIARVLLIAFGLVVAFPYLPASDSPAFAGVSVFMGVLVSLASSSALSNMIAGIVLTYTSAFRVGDRVKLGDAFGDIIETSLLATRVRTIKNEHVTIPNSIALGSAVTNYSRPGKTPGLILHTSVTIGYDVPWRKVHDLLIDAALATPGLRAEPRPFVWQTALNDFYVTYEINAYTDAPRDMIDIYAALHARIQDAFCAAGVEIMSPHYTSLRDGNAVAIPEALRPSGYRAPAFRVLEDVPPVEVAPEHR
jgi:small-conductance mechanosensitive channel